MINAKSITTLINKILKMTTLNCMRNVIDVK